MYDAPNPRKNPMPLDPADLIEIQQLYARYNTAIDTGDGETFAGCFAEDAYFDSGISQMDSHEDIAAFAVQTHTAMPSMRHNATNILLDSDGGGGAHGSAFLIGYITDGGYKVIVTGRYADELTRTSEGWRFAKRVFKADGA
jgi:Tol biopolymer transport system component